MVKRLAVGDKVVLDMTPDDGEAHVEVTVVAVDEARGVYVVQVPCGPSGVLEDVLPFEDPADAESELPTLGCPACDRISMLFPNGDGLCAEHRDC